MRRRAAVGKESKESRQTAACFGNAFNDVSVGGAGKEDKERIMNKSRVKTIVNQKGETMASRIEIPIEGSYSELTEKAVISLTSLMNGLKEMKTEKGIVTHYHIICGFLACCELCGFLTEQSTNDLMQTVKYLVENELARVAGNDSL